MSEEAAAAIDADSATDKRSSGKPDGYRLNDSARTAEDMTGKALQEDGVKTIDAAQVADKVCSEPTSS